MLVSVYRSAFDEANRADQLGWFKIVYVCLALFNQHSTSLSADKHLKSTSFYPRPEQFDFRTLLLQQPNVFKSRQWSTLGRIKVGKGSCLFRVFRKGPYFISFLSFQVHQQISLRRYFNKDILPEMSKTIGVRKNIQRLDQNQRKQYFWCLKMLSILPPFKANKKRYFYSLGVPGPDGLINNPNPYNKIEPLCLYDELISSHATACEHMSFYFGYYHRHLMFYFQVLLNYVDEVLREKTCSFKEKFPEIYAKSGRWDEFLKLYQDKAPEKKVMAHYWNPTNYNSRDDTVIPIELADPEFFPHQLDIIDYIFYQVRQHYPYEVNFRLRWYNEQGQKNYDKESTIKRMQNDFPYFFDGYTPTKNQEQLIAGKLNPRTPGRFNQFLNTYKAFTNFIDDKHINNSMKITSSRNKQYFLKTDKMKLFGQNEGQSLVNMGSRFNANKQPYNMHYFNQNQLNNRDVTERVNQINYNNMVPHYQLGYALYNSKFDKFIEYLDPTSRKHLERSHNTMHNNMHFSMIDSNFSLVNMVFFSYHSWIDAQLELKIRLSQSILQAHRLLVKLESKWETSQLMDPIFSLSSNDPQLVGDYPIMEWCDPIFVSYIKNQDLSEQQINQILKDYSVQDTIKPAFKARDYYLVQTPTQLRIRTSKDLGDFYRDNYINQNIQRLQQYSGFKDFDASYEIQIFETLYDQTTGTFKDVYQNLGDKQSKTLYIPQYLQAMKDQVNRQEIFLVTFTQNYLSKLINPRSLNYYLRLVQNSILLHVQYKSSTPNGNYLVNASFKNLIELLKTKKYQVINTISQSIQIPEEPIGVLNITIFGKGNHANLCPHCGEHKNILANMSEQLFSRHRALWSYVNLVLTRQIIYDTYEPEKYIAENDKVDLRKVLAVENLANQFKFVYINGAEQALFDVYFKSPNTKPLDFHVTVQLEIASVQNGKPKSVALKQIELSDIQARKSLQDDQTVLFHSFDFYNLKDKSPKSRSELDGLIYSRATFHVFANNHSLNFSFPIKSYHEIIRYKVVIAEDLTKQTLRAVVSDADYDFKLELYKAGLTL